MGYDVYAQSPARDEPLRLLYIKHGSRVFGRVPVVPGFLPVVTIQLAEDAERLRVDGQLIRLEESLVDVVARRELFFSRIRLRFDAGDVAGAATLLAELRRLPTREEFAYRIAQLENSVTSRDPAVQAEVAWMLAQTRAALGKFLDSRPVAELQSQLDRARAAGE